MNDTDIKNDAEVEDSLNAFLKDIHILDGLNKLEKEENLFDILRISQTEIRHSNVLAWLFNPQRSKDVGKFFLQKIIIYIMDHAENINVADLIVDDFENVEVHREREHTDLLIIFKKNDAVHFVICIENKIKSRQGKTQLDSYRQKIESMKEFKAAKKNNRICFLFLRVKNESPNDQNWIEIDYNEIGTILKDALVHCSMSQETRFFLNQYLSTLRKYDMMDDPELQDLAQKIYNKHREALDFIYDNAQNEDALKFKHYHNWLAGKKDFITRQNKASASIQFATEDLYSKIFGNYKKLKIKTEDLVQYCYYEIQKRFMNEIKLVLHKDASLPKDVQDKLDAARTKLIKKTDPVWQWTSAHKVKIGTEHLFDKYDLNEDKLDEELTKILNNALEKCQSAVLEKI